MVCCGSRAAVLLLESEGVLSTAEASIWPRVARGFAPSCLCPVALAGYRHALECSWTLPYAGAVKKFCVSSMRYSRLAPS